jgi:hypothetical protein
LAAAWCGPRCAGLFSRQRWYASPA